LYCTQLAGIYLDDIGAIVQPPHRSATPSDQGRPAP
jgi:hypothetical protein